MAADATERGRPEASTLTTPLVPEHVVERRPHAGGRPGVTRKGGILLDVFGAVLWLALVLWVVRVARTPAAAAPARDLLLLAGAVYVLARVTTLLQPWFLPTAAVVVGTLTAVWTINGVLSGGGGALFGYANAAGAFHVACVTAGLMAYARLRAVPWFARMPAVRPSDLRRVVIAGVVVCAVVPWVTTAVTSAVLVLVLPLSLVTRELGWRVRQVVVGSALVGLAVIGGTVAVAATFGDGGVDDWLVSSALSSNRGQLWSEALDAAVANPVLGVGTGRFAQVSATAAADTDLRWAHSAFLQVAAETGLPGFALGLALLLWMFARMWATGRDLATGVASAGLAAMVVTASIDYVWHFPGVVLVTMAVAGCGPVRTARRGAAGGGAVRVSEPRRSEIDLTDRTVDGPARPSASGPGRRGVPLGGAEPPRTAEGQPWPRPLGSDLRRDH